MNQTAEQKTPFADGEVGTGVAGSSPRPEENSRVLLFSVNLSPSRTPRRGSSRSGPGMQTLWRRRWPVHRLIGQVVLYVKLKAGAAQVCRALFKTKQNKQTPPFVAAKTVMESRHLSCSALWDQRGKEGTRVLGVGCVDVT